MIKTAKRNAALTTTRSGGLRQMLTDRRRELQDDVQNGLRDGRTDRPNEGGDGLEDSEADIQGDIKLALLQMRTETLTLIDEALVRLDAGRYGLCCECAAAISERRLRALLFAVRCQACAARHEQAQGHEQRLAQRRGGFSLFLDGASS